MNQRLPLGDWDCASNSPRQISHASIPPTHSNEGQAPGSLKGPPSSAACLSVKPWHPWKPGSRNCKCLGQGHASPRLPLNSNSLAFNFPTPTMPLGYKILSPSRCCNFIHSFIHSSTLLCDHSMPDIGYRCQGETEATGLGSPVKILSY